jgi:phosphopentomutase
MKQTKKFSKKNKYNMKKTKRNRRKKGGMMMRSSSKKILQNMRNAKTVGEDILSEIGKDQLKQKMKQVLTSSNNIIGKTKNVLFKPYDLQSSSHSYNNNNNTKNSIIRKSANINIDDDEDDYGYDDAETPYKLNRNLTNPNTPEKSGPEPKSIVLHTSGLTQVRKKLFED